MSNKNPRRKSHPHTVCGQSPLYSKDCKRSGEASLCVAIIVQALEDVSAGGELRREAIRWFATKKGWFEKYCDYTDLSPEMVRQCVKLLANRQESGCPQIKLKRVVFGKIAGHKAVSM